MLSQDQISNIMHETFLGCQSIFGQVFEEYLYGSYARGDFHEDSDVDILVTIKEDQYQISKKRFDIAELSSELSLKYGITVSISVKSLEQFESLNRVLPFYQNVIKEGIRHTE